MSTVKVSILSFLMASTLSLGAFAAKKNHGTPKEIVIGDMAFATSEITIKMGEAIKWVNKDIVPHTVTAEDNSFDSKNIAPGKSWVYVPKKVGKFPYKCAYHPTMTASFAVE